MELGTAFFFSLKKTLASINHFGATTLIMVDVSP